MQNTYESDAAMEVEYDAAEQLVTDGINIQSKNYASMGQLLADYPALEDMDRLKKWILDQPREAKEFLRRSQTQYRNSDEYFSFVKRKYVKLFQNTIAIIEPTRNYVIKRCNKKRPSKKNRKRLSKP